MKILEILKLSKRDEECFHQLISRLDATKEKFSELEYRSVENNQTETQRGKNVKKKIK